MMLLIQLELRVSDLKGVGVGCPGVLLPNGVVHAAANFPSWSVVPLQQLLTDRLGVPVWSSVVLGHGQVVEV